MLKEKNILIITIISIMLCACSVSKDTSTSDVEEFSQATKGIEQILETNTSQTASVSPKVIEAATTFEYDFINHTITITLVDICHTVVQIMPWKILCIVLIIVI